MFKFCELWTVILWYELNPRVRCAFGNVYILFYKLFLSFFLETFQTIWFTWLPLSNIATNPKGKTFSKLSGMKSSYTFASIRDCKQGQIGLERSASWSLIPIHGPGGSKQ